MKHLKLILAVCVILGISLNLAASEKFTKEYNESFNVSKTALLKMVNHFADVECKIWNQDVVQIDAIITVYAKDQKNADKIFDEISIEMEGNTNKVFCETTIGDFGSGTTKFDIKIQVKLPATLSLDFNTQFGNIFLGDYQGKTDIHIQYGELQIDQLHHAENKINLEYSDMIAEKIGRLKLNADYSDVNIDEVDYLDLRSSYTEYKFDILKEVELRSSFDEMEIGSVNVIEGVTNYSEIDIENLTNSLNFESEFGEVKIESIAADFDFIYFESDYCDGDFDFENECSYEFSANLQYSSLHMDNKSSMLREKSGIQTYKYKGDVGSNPKSKVTIIAEFATIEIK